MQYRRRLRTVYIYNAGSVFSGVYENNIEFDPKFIFPSSGIGIDYDGLAADWSLQPYSLCINTGNPDTTELHLPELDPAGNNRIYSGSNTRVDIGAYEFQGEPVVNVKQDQLVIPFKTQLCGNYPNPFNSETIIKFALAKESNVVIDIFNINGQKINTIIDCEMNTGNHQVIWNGRDYFGIEMTSGIYYAKFTCNNIIQTSKMILLK